MPKRIRVYGLGYNFCEDVAVPIKDVDCIETARNLIKSNYANWKDYYTNEDYKKRFGKEKVNILNEKIGFIRNLINVNSFNDGYCNYWQESDKGGRGAIKCYIFHIEDSWSEYNEYMEDIEQKKQKCLNNLIDKQVEIELYNKEIKKGILKYDPESGYDYYYCERNGYITSLFRTHEVEKIRVLDANGKLEKEVEVK